MSYLQKIFLVFKLMQNKMRLKLVRVNLMKKSSKIKMWVGLRRTQNNAFRLLVLLNLLPPPVFLVSSNWNSMVSLWMIPEGQFFKIWFDQCPILKFFSRFKLSYFLLRF